MKTEDGISPLIGTILLIVITVILIAIISAVIMGITATSDENVLQGERYINVYQTNNGDLVYMLTRENFCNIVHVYVDGEIYDVNLNAFENEYRGEQYRPYTVSNISNGSHNIKIVGIYMHWDTNREMEMYNKTLIF